MDYDMLSFELWRRNVSIHKLAEMTQKNYKALWSKMSGHGEMRVSDIIAITEALGLTNWREIFFPELQEIKEKEYLICRKA